MTSKFSIDNRELLQRISSGEAVVGIDFGNLIVRELAAFRLAAMGSEPDCKERKLFCSTDTARMKKVISVSAGSDDAPLYRHAQPVPVVSADLLHTAASAIEDLLTNKDRTGSGVWFDLPFRLRSAANEQTAPVVPENCVTAEHRRVIEMLLSVCGAAFELADDSCQQDVDGEDCHVVPDDAFQKLSDALDEIENTLPTEDIDRPDVFLARSAMPRAALKSLLQAQPAPVVPAVSDDIGEIRVGRLPTMNQDDYPGLGDWWVQLRIGEDSDEVLARVYGATPQEANNRAEALACRAAMLNQK
jgi:hypothetical protein